MQVAALQYQYDFPSSFDAYRRKITSIVQSHHQKQVSLLLFPEYAGLEMLSFSTIDTIDHYLKDYLDLFHHLSSKYNMYICSGSHVISDGSKRYNRSYLFSPTGSLGFQDKCILTPFEKNEGLIAPADLLKIFDTRYGKIAICICYDIEFPFLVSKLAKAGAQAILVPSYTASYHGFYRVFVACRARALEHQMYTIQSALVGKTDLEMAYGSACICSPIDQGFPEDGLVALGQKDQVGSIISSLDLLQVAAIKTSGETRNHLDSLYLENRSLKLQVSNLG